MADWPHAPLHRFGDTGFYFITAGTLYKEHFFREPGILDRLQDLLFEKAQFHGVTLQAWSLFSNHYHLVVSADEGASVRAMVTRFHVDSAIRLNQRDGVKGRRVWYQFWDLQLTREASWLARLRYTHENAVHHRLVAHAMNYRWCSAAWFAETAPSTFVKTVGRMKIDMLTAHDALD